MDVVTDKIKKLNQELSSLNMQIESQNMAKERLKGQIQDITEETQTLQQEKKTVSKEITKVSHHVDGLEVTEHATIRYMERAMGFDMDALKQKMLDEVQPMYIGVRTDGKYPMTTGLTAVVVNGKVLTVR